MAFDYFNSAENKRRIEPTHEERRALKDCWDEINPSGDNKVHGKKVVKYMQALGLGQYQIREIWKIANADSDEYLDEEQMFVAIRLIGYAQKGLEISQQNLSNPAGGHKANIAMGKIQSAPQRLPKNMLLPDQQTINSFHNKWLTLEHKSSGLAKGSDIKKKYANQASRDVLSQIWAMCSRTVKGHLTKGQTLLFQHFLSLKKQNVSVNSLPQQSKQLIGQIDYQNAYKIKSYSNQLQLQKQNYEKISNPQIDVDQIDRQVDSNNHQIQLLKSEIFQLKTEQASNISQAFDTIQRLKKIIQVQNGQIKQLKTTLVNRGELDTKRAQFVQVCQYTVSESEYINYNMKKKQTPLSTNTEVPSRNIIEHYQPQPSQNNSEIRRSSYQSPQLVQLRQKTIKLIMQKTSMMPHDLRLLKRRISEMTFEELKGQYNDLESKYKPEKEPTQMDASLASVQKLEIIKNVFGNVSLDEGQL